MDYDIIIIGGGNAGYSAATTAAQHGAKRVLVLEKGSDETGGGNTFFTAGAFRTVFTGLSDVLTLVTNDDDEVENEVEMAPYTEHDFLEDLYRVTDNRTDKLLAETLVKNSRDAVGWLRDIGVRFTLSFERQAYKVDGKYKFWGGMVLSVKDGGKGLMSDHKNAAKNAGVTTWFNTTATSLITSTTSTTTTIIGVEIIQNSNDPASTRKQQLFSSSVILSCGGFEANPCMRSQYLGPEWENAYVRGTPHNTGDGFNMTSHIARRAGDWSGCHSTAWDAASPNRHSGDPILTNAFTKSGYPLGIMLNLCGHRFVDEGEDFRNYTYAKFGRAILAQPENLAFQIWDAQTITWLRKEEYSDEILKSNKIVANSIMELAEQMYTSNSEAVAQAVATIQEYNTAIYAHKQEFPKRQWNPTCKDNLSTQSSTYHLKIPKSNWALPIDTPPFMAVKVTCGITFTFGGLQIDPGTAEAISLQTGMPIPGLYCCGEMVGGLFWGNYPGGSGLTAGTVWGRKAGQHAAVLKKLNI